MRDKPRPPLQVVRDSDGGLTITEPQSGLVLSVIATHPNASGPHGVFIEVYSYQPGDVMWQEATRREAGDDTPIRFGIASHPTIAFYPQSRKEAADAD